MYLWWTRLAGYDGLSAVPRPGVPAVSLALTGALHLPLTAVIAGLEVGLAVGLGLASQAFARRGGARATTAFVAGLLAGTFGVHLASGYLATLAFAAAFVAGVVALEREDRASLVVAVALFAAAVLSHPLFSLLGLGILAGAAWLSWRDRPEDAARIGRSLVGTGAVAGVAIAALQLGPEPLAVDTSRDGFLRRAGLGDVLRAAYLDRAIHRWTRYVQWISVPLAIAGWTRPTTFVRRVLASWALVSVVGAAFALATGLLPADRFVTFGFVVPILAAFGLERLVDAVSRRSRALAGTAAAILVVAMLAGAWIAWSRQEPFIDDAEIDQTVVADAVVAGQGGDPSIAVVVDQRDETVSFLATRAANVIRAAVDPSRIRDVIVVVPHAGPGASRERVALGEVTNDDLGEARPRVTMFALRAFLEQIDELDEGWTFVTPDVATATPVEAPAVEVRADAPQPPPERATALGIVGAAIAIVLFLGASGYGWLGAAGWRRDDAVGVAVATGWAAFTLIAIALERLGVPLTGPIGPSVVSSVALLGGYVLRAVLERRAGA